MALQVWLPLNGDLRNQGVSDVTVTNSGATINTNGKIGSCYSFNGSSSYITTDIKTSSSMSFCCWVYFNSFDGAQLIDCRNNSAVGYQPMYITQSYIQIGNSQNGFAEIGYSFSASTWYHIVVANNESKTWVYINGSLIGERNIGGYDFGTLNIPIGVRCSRNMYYLNGRLNDVRIYDHCLSAAEVKEISKGLVLHYKLDDPYVESTVNYGRMSETVTIRSECINDWSVQKLDRDTVKVTALKDNPSYAQYGDVTYTLGSYKTVSAGNPCTLSCEVVDYKGSLSRIYPASGGFGSIMGYGTLFNRVSRTITHSVDWTHNIIIRTSSQSQIKAGDYIVIRNTQIELKDHATPYTPNARGIQTKYDTSVYTEPDGTKWVRIVHHSNPANGLFTQGSSWGSSVYVDSNRWYDVNDTINALTKYEFMVKQKNTSSASEVKYRWVQKKSPLTATWYDVKASEVVRNTSSGYTDGGYGGLYILNSNTYLCIANGSNGNWYGAFGCWTTYSGGIPGYPNTVVTSGYMDLYVRVDDIVQTVYDSSGYKYNGEIIDLMQATSDSARYKTSTWFDGDSTGILINNIQLNEIINNAITWSFWIKPYGENGARSIYCGCYNNSYVWNIEKTAGNVLRWFWNWNIDVSTSVSITDGSWQHIVITKNGASDVKFYKNGSLVQSITTSHPVLSFPTMFRIGRDERSADGTPYHGSMSDFRIYSTALSADDVKELYNTSAYIYNNGTIASLELNEGLTNIISKLEYNRQKKVWADGLSSYTQTHCQCTLTDDGYRIYRTPNLVYSSVGTVMWGGFVIDNTDNRFNLQDGHTYMLQFEVKGQTSNSVTSIYWANLVGWGGGGLSPTPSNVISANPVTSNYNSSEWKTFTYQWTISDGVYKVCTSAYHTFEQGKTYISYKGFKYGFDYMDTGSLGTDLYIKNIRMFDITNTNHTDIMKTGIIDTNSVTEEILPAEISMGGIVGNQIMEI